MACCAACSSPVTRARLRREHVVGAGPPSPSIDEGPPVYNAADQSLTYAAGSRVFLSNGTLEAVSAERADGSWVCPPGTSALYIGDNPQPDCRFPQPIVNRQADTLYANGSVLFADGSFFDGPGQQWTSKGGTVLDMQGNVLAQGTDYCTLFPDQCPGQGAGDQIATILKWTAAVLALVLIGKVVW